MQGRRIGLKLLLQLHLLRLVLLNLLMLVLLLLLELNEGCELLLPLELLQGSGDMQLLLKRTLLGDEGPEHWVGLWVAQWHKMGELAEL